MTQKYLKLEFRFWFPSRQDRKTNSFVCFSGEITAWQFCFEIYFPMAEKIWVLLTYCLTFVHQPAAFLSNPFKKSEEIPGNSIELLGIPVTSWEIQRNPGKYRKIQGDPSAILWNPGICREIQRNPGKSREIQGNPGKSRELQETSCFDSSMF